MSDRASGRRLLRCVALVALPFAAFATALTCGFVWLDEAEIVQGAYRARNVADVSRLFSESLDAYSFRDQGRIAVQGGYWRPLYGLSVTLDWWLWGPHARWYHFESIAWHAAVVLLLYRLGLCLAGESRDGRFAAFWSAAMFAVHPTCLQSVTWISGRKDALCACFGVGAILVAQRGRSSRPMLAACISTGLFAIALGCKELAIAVPVFLGFQQVCCRRPVAAGDTSRVAGLWTTLTLMGVVTAAWLAWRTKVTGGVGLNVPHLAGRWEDWLATQCRLWVHSVLCVVQPIPPLLSDRWPAVPFRSLAGVLAVAACVGGGVGIVRMARRSDPRLVCVAWFLIWMLPASGIVPLRHVRAERYLYPASWGLLMAGVWWLHSVLRDHVRLQQQLPKFCVAVVLLWGSVTAWESLSWRSDLTLFTQAIARDSAYVEGHLALASYHLRQGNYEEAVALSEQGITLAENERVPGYWSPLIARTNYGLALYHLQRPREALRQFRLVQEMHPALPLVHYHTGLAALAIPDYSLATEHLRRAYQLDPDDDLTAANLAFALLQRNDPEGCLQVLRPVLQRDPEDLNNRRNFGSALLLLERYREALPHLKAAAELSGAEAGDLARVAWAWWGVGDRPQAVQWLRRAESRAEFHPAVQFVRELLEPRRGD